jgi:hypothetical protein
MGDITGDLIMLVITVVFLAATFGFLSLCERVEK